MLWSCWWRRLWIAQPPSNARIDTQSFFIFCIFLLLDFFFLFCFYFLVALVSSFYFSNRGFGLRWLPPRSIHPQEKKHSFHLRHLTLDRGALFFWPAVLHNPRGLMWSALNRTTCSLKTSDIHLRHCCRHSPDSLPTPGCHGLSWLVVQHGSWDIKKTDALILPQSNFWSSN